MTANLHDAVLGMLAVNAALTALLADSLIEASPSEPAIYDDVPQVEESESDDAFPYLVIGEFTAANVDADDKDGQEHTCIIHVWSRYHGGHEARQIADAVRDALHDCRLDVSGAHTVFCYWEFTETVPDPDPRLRHIVLRFRIITQD
jgi:hypothetical protein